MKRGNGGEALRESINRTRKFWHDQRNPVEWEHGEREALIQQAIERGMVRKVSPGMSAFQTFWHKAPSSQIPNSGWRHGDFNGGGN